MNFLSASVAASSEEENHAMDKNMQPLFHHGRILARIQLRTAGKLISRPHQLAKRKQTLPPYPLAQRRRANRFMQMADRRQNATSCWSCRRARILSSRFGRPEMSVHRGARKFWNSASANRVVARRHNQSSTRRREGRRRRSNRQDEARARERERGGSLCLA